MYKYIKDLSIGYKIHLPVILTIFIGLGTVIFNAYLELDHIEQKSRTAMIKQMQLYVQQGLDEKKQIGLTNAINLSLNTLVQQALKRNDREMIRAYLNNFSTKLAENTNYKNLKIHIHDKEVKSFIRHWKPSKYGDDLSTFRDSLNYVKAHRHPVSVIEPGRAGMLIRGVAPVLEGDAYLGSVEFIQGFNFLVHDAKEDNDYSLLFFTYTSERINRFNSQTPMIGDMFLSQDLLTANQELFSALGDMDSSKLYKSDFFLKQGYFITAIPLFDILNKEIGSVLVALPQSRVDAIVDQAKGSLISQIWIMIGVDLVILILLLVVLHYGVKKPIKDLNNKVEKIKNSLVSSQNILELSQLKIKTDREDEIGSIAKMINSLLKTLMREFVKVQRVSKTTEEYIKAINAGSIVSKSDLEGTITFVNQAFCDVTGYTQGELMGKPHNIIRHPNTSRQTFKTLWKTIQSGNIWHGLLKNNRKDGTTFYANTTIVPIKNEKNKVVEYVALRNDVTDLVNYKEELKRTFLTDPLTSFGNRFKMLDTLEKNPDSCLAIIDIHSFKEVNDFYGHEVGDKLIVAFGNKLFEFFNEESMEVFHLSGDEFSVVCSQSSVSEVEFISRVNEFFNRYNHSEVVIGEYIISLSLTCGISGASKHPVNHADIAYKNAKKLNKNIVIYSEEISTDIEYKKNLEWTRKIKKAIEEDRIKAFYQPIYNNKTHTIAKYETLMRLIEEDGTEISPYFFLDIAKKTRHYKALTRIIVEQAFKQFEKSTHSFSINLSAEDIVMHNIGEYMFDLAKQYGVHNRVVLEIVESEGIESFDTVETFIREAKANGMKIAIDDFGTGYSNFEYLIRLSTDYLKIDGSLIKSIDTDQNMRSVVETMVMFAKKNNIKTIAEFVSTKEIQEVVDELDIDYSQGYYHGKPSPSPQE